MIVDKNKQPIEPAAPETPIEDLRTEEQVIADLNPMVEAYRAVRTILESIKEDPNDPNSPPLFKTIKIDNGQLSRIKHNIRNPEYGIAFPAVFIHYINIYYNVGASKVSEGKGTMRIHYVLNNLNNGDDEVECVGMMVYKRIISAIESQKYLFPSLVERFQLQYWDQPETFDDGVQPYWIDYQIWFRDYTAYAYKDYVDTYLTQPPFTQPTDQNSIANPDNMGRFENPTMEDNGGDILII